MTDIDLIDEILMFAHEDDVNPCPADIAMTAVEVTEKLVLKIIDGYIEKYQHFTVCKSLLTQLRADVYKEINE